MLLVVLLASGLFSPVRGMCVTGQFMDMYALEPDTDSAWFMETMGITAAHELTDGSGIVVALIDSGVDMEHPALAGCIERNLSYNVADQNYDLTDYLGHGTLMAGAICAACETGYGFCGVAPGVELIVYKITSGSGYTFDDITLARAITMAADGPADIINLSLVIDDSDQVREAVVYAMSRGKVVVAAAGNIDQVVDFPAEIDGVVATGAMYPSLVPVEGTGLGPYLVVSAPGYNIGTTAAGGGYGATTGTSVSAALTSGVFALLRSVAPGLSTGSLRALVAGASLDTGWPGFDLESGFGMVHALAAIQSGGHAGSSGTEYSLSLETGAPEYHRGDFVSMTLTMDGFGGRSGDLYIQETDPRGDRFYFQYGSGEPLETPQPYTAPLAGGGPYTFPGSGTMRYPVFSQTSGSLLGPGRIDPGAAVGLYEMVVAVATEGALYQTRQVVWIGDR